MRQRVGIARAFALSPKVLLLDEPFGMLDSLTRIELQDVLVDSGDSERKTVLMVTHDVDEALFLSDRVAMMTTGPAARSAASLAVPFARPRDRGAGPRAPRLLPAARGAHRLPGRGRAASARGSDERARHRSARARSIGMSGSRTMLSRRVPAGRAGRRRTDEPRRRPRPLASPEPPAVKVAPYGTLYFNGFKNTDAVNNQDVPLWVVGGAGDV